jgi:uncharacterized protein (TIGR03067 family)
LFERDKEIAVPRTYTVDSKAKPATMDLQVGVTEKEMALAIFKVEGDKLTICRAMPGKPRPTKFEVAEGSTDYLLVLRRVKE